MSDKEITLLFLQSISGSLSHQSVGKEGKKVSKLFHLSWFRLENNFSRLFSSGLKPKHHLKSIFGGLLPFYEIQPNLIRTCGSRWRDVTLLLFTFLFKRSLRATLQSPVLGKWSCHFLSERSKMMLPYKDKKLVRWRLQNILSYQTILSDFLMVNCFQIPISLRTKSFIFTKI